MEDIHNILDSHIDNIINLCENIYQNPELGFKEFKTRQKIIDMLEKNGIEYKDCAYTGIISEIKSQKKGPHIALICELDGVPTQGHPYASKLDNAAHTCGHYAQIGVMLNLFIAIKKSNIMNKLCGKVSLIVTPAEEFCDLDYRKQLVKEGKISYTSGKQEMISLGVFDNIDIVLSCHTMGLDMEKYYAEIGASLNGFICKQVEFYGKSAHAGSNPAGGINSLNAINLAMTGINFLRETFKEEDAIRVHFIVKEGGQTVNSVPSLTKMEMYIRAKTTKAIFETNKKVERVLKGSAFAIGCDLSIIDNAGYFPLHQDENLTELVKTHILKYIDKNMIAKGTHGFASGDMGDLSMLLPIVEIGIAGFRGTMHGIDFETSDYEQAYKVPAHYFADTIIDLLLNNGEKAYKIKNDFKPIMTKEDYLKNLDNLNKTNFYIFKEEGEFLK